MENRTFQRAGIVHNKREFCLWGFKMDNCSQFSGKILQCMLERLLVRVGLENGVGLQVKIVQSKQYVVDVGEF